VSYRIAVLVSGEGTNLQAMIDTVHGREGIEIACVGSSRHGARAVERAERAGIECAVFAAADHSGRAARDAALADWIAAHKVDLIVLAGFMELLDATFVRRFEGRIINIHPSLLPAFPGTRAIEDAVAHGVRITGVTVHFVDERVDSGPIVLQRALELPYSRDIVAIERTVHDLEHELLPRALRLLASGAVRIDPTSPRHVLIEEDGAAGDTTR